MKKTLNLVFALVLTLVMVMTAVSALAVGSKGAADLVNEESKMVIVDPDTGEETEVEDPSITVVETESTTPAGQTSAKDKLMAALKNAVDGAETENELNTAILGALPSDALTALSDGIENEKDLTTVNETATLQLVGENLENGGNMEPNELIVVTVEFPTVFPDDAKISVLIGILNADQTEYIGWLAKPAKASEGKVTFTLTPDDVKTIGSNPFDVFVLE